MEVLEEKENFLLDRKEIKIIVDAEKNPSYVEALNLVSEKFKAEKDNVVIKGIKGKFGRDTFLISAFIYKSKEDKEKFEKKKEKKAEQAIEQKLEESKQSIAEEKKEEVSEKK